MEREQRRRDYDKAEFQIFYFKKILYFKTFKLVRFQIFISKIDSDFKVCFCQILGKKYFVKTEKLRKILIS